MGNTYDYLEKRREGKLQFLRRKTNDKIYIRFRLKDLKRYIYKSTGTTDFVEGLRLGLDLYDEVKWKHQNNINVFDYNIKYLWKLWFDWRERQGGSDGRIHFIESTGRLYIVPYFGKYKGVEVNDVVVEEYWTWRKRYWVDGYGIEELERSKRSRVRKTKDGTRRYKNKKGNVSKTPSDNTLRMEQSLLKEFLGWCNRQGYIRSIPLVKRPQFGRPTSNNRPHFEPEEWEKLHRYLNKWSVEGEDRSPERTNGKFNKEQKGKSRVNSNHRHQRQMLKNYVMILRNTGMRTGELSQVRWRDIELVDEEGKDEPFLRIYVSQTTKTRKSRYVVCRPHTQKYFDRLKSMTENTKPDDLIFSHKNGKPIDFFGRTFKKVLKDTDLLENKEGLTRTLYSLRHTYITDRLSRGVPIDIVSKNCGTSISHIQNTYRHDTVSQHSDQLLKKLPKRKS